MCFKYEYINTETTIEYTHTSDKNVSLCGLNGIQNQILYSSFFPKVTTACQTLTWSITIKQSNLVSHKYKKTYSTHGYSYLLPLSSSEIFVQVKCPSSINNHILMQQHKLHHLPPCCINHERTSKAIPSSGQHGQYHTHIARRTWWLGVTSKQREHEFENHCTLEFCHVRACW